MKKRFGAILALAMMIVVMSTSFAFAGTLELEDTYPRNGDTGMQIENSGVKLYFNQNMISKENEKANLDCFKFTDEKGRALPIRVLYSPKEEGLVLVLVDNQTLESNSSYKLYISGDVAAKSGDTLGEDLTIEFQTVDTNKATTINMVLTFVMMGGVMFASSRAAKQQQKNQTAEKEVEEKFNPYKIAKETGKSVAEVLREEEANREKQRKKIEKKKAKEAALLAELEEEDYDDEDDVIESDNKRVKGPRPASVAGSKYVEQLRAKRAEEAKRKAAAGTTNPKNKSKKKKH